MYRLLIAVRRVNCALALLLLLLGFGCALHGDRRARLDSDSPTVGRAGANSYVTPTGQLLTPAGQQVELPGMRPQALALSPDGRLLATAGKNNTLVLIDPASGRILQTLALATNRSEANLEKSTDPGATLEFRQSIAFESKTNSAATNAVPTSPGAQMSFTGLTFSPDGRRIFLANAAGNVRAFAVNKSRQVHSPVSIPVPESNAPKEKKEIPTGLAVSPDGKRLYVAGNLGNKLHELDAASGRLLRSWKTGVAPYDVVLVARKAYVSNIGGRRPGKDDLTAPAGKGMTVRVDPVRRLPNEGSVTVIDLATGRNKTEIVVGRHASAMAVSPDQRYVVVANTGDDTISVIDTRADRVVEKIWTRQTPADLFGAQPNALAFDPSGHRLYVCNGTQNAVAVIKFEPEDNASKVIGLIPVGWFPGAVVFDPARRGLCVANIKGIGAIKTFRPAQKIKRSSKDFSGLLSLVPIPSEEELARWTALALANMRYPKLAEAQLPARPNQPARPVPERAGEPSLFKHVVYVLKENRSYDQVLGDMPGGDGHPDLCTFGDKYTPNQHKIAREFVLLDNTYCAGVQSADGHQWTDSAIANEYVERQLTSDFPRSYAGGKVEDGVDALNWSSAGFIWDNALAHGKTFRNYGEWMISKAHWRDKKAHKGEPRWVDFWNDYLSGSNVTRLASSAGIATLAKCSPTNTVGWDLNVPDVMRAAFFIQELHRFEAEGGFPNFILLFLPNDHTGGTRGRSPTPGAQIADNDLALGHVLEALSHSKFWPETCLFAIEDDPQAGWDHVSGYRTTCYLASPYTRRGETVSTQYNQLSLVRTMELILGLPPMNQMDATATPMADCFTEVADLTPFHSVTNTFPIDTLNPEPKRIFNRILRKDAIVSSRLRLDEPDRCPEDVLNRILWHAMKGPDVPYPEWAVKAVADND